VTAFVVVLTIGILALAGLTLDGGLALAAKVQANGQAQAAARAGAQAIDLTAYRATGTLQLVPAQAVADAQSYLAGIGAVTAIERTQLLGMVGISSLAVHGQGSAHPQRGVVNIEP